MAVVAKMDSDLTDPLYPVAVLIDELRHDELHMRKNAIKRKSSV